MDAAPLDSLGALCLATIAVAFCAQSGKLQLVASQRFHARLWAEAVAAVQNEPSSVLAGLFIESLNDVLALHAKWFKQP